MRVPMFANRIESSNKIEAMTSESLSKFETLLRRLLQFDCADLDFGIYRILNYKRVQIEEFLTKRLPKIVDEKFAKYAVVDRKEIEQEIERLRKDIQEAATKLGDNPFDPLGRLVEKYRKSPIGKELANAEEKLTRFDVGENLKAQVYNKLYSFFQRYYEEGDFISKRRVSGRNETYAIPYNGEEVILYWANRDQYYIKTGERFKSYRFSTNGITVNFELRSVEWDQNQNVKRYFVLSSENAIKRNGNSLSMFFEWRSLTENEQKKYGRTGQQRSQESFNKEAEGNSCTQTSKSSTATNSLSYVQALESNHALSPNQRHPVRHAIPWPQKYQKHFDLRSTWRSPFQKRRWRVHMQGGWHNRGSENTD